MCQELNKQKIKIQAKYNIFHIKCEKQFPNLGKKIIQEMEKLPEY